MTDRPDNPDSSPPSSDTNGSPVRLPDENGEYTVDLDAFSGPLDLLLYLIRREEVDIYDIPVARITEQYLTYLDALTDLDVEVAGEFIVMAATLLEIKARMMAPEPVEEEEEEEGEDPRLELVRQLIEYRRFKEAALSLSDRQELRTERFARVGERYDDGGERVVGVPENVNLWALLEAFSSVLRQTGARGPLTVQLDHIPQEQLNSELERRLRTAGRITFFDAFEEHESRPMLVGMFFAVLELARLQVLRVEQEENFGEIWLTYVPPEERETAPAAHEDHESDGLNDAADKNAGHDEPTWDGEEEDEDEDEDEDWSDLPEVPEAEWEGLTGPDESDDDTDGDRPEPN